MKEESDRKYTFKNITFRSGLAVKQISSGGLKLVGTAPTNITPFFTAKFLLDHPPFQPWIRQFTQDNIKPYQQVRIDSGKHRSLVGYMTYVQDDKDTIIAHTDTHQELSILILLRMLSLCYRPSDTIKHQWSNSTGIVMTIDKENKELSYVKDGTGNLMKASFHNMEFTTPDLHFYTMHVGTWVNFNKGGDSAEPWHGHVIYVMDTHAMVKEEHTEKEFDLNICNLDMSSIQG
ncbi:hypothetical protein EI94DRAFT_1809282 [Lactarius quietus]|nr:hypothetical protein EI94DRAFT_1809282 [Lactarius quietus]